MGTVFNQFSLLVWKNFVLQKRRPVATLFELLLPILFSVLLVIIRDNVTVIDHKNMTTWREYSVDSLPEFYKAPPGDTWTIAYAPNNIKWIEGVMNRTETSLNKDTVSEVANLCGFDYAEDYEENNLDELLFTFKETVMSKPQQDYVNKTLDCVLSTLPKALRDRVEQLIQNSTISNFDKFYYMAEALYKIRPKVKLQGFASEQEFVAFVKNDTNLENVLAGVMFSGDLNDTTIPERFKMALRFHSDPVNSDGSQSAFFTGIMNTWKTHNLFPLFQMPGPRENTSVHGGAPGYYKEGFLSLQHALYMSVAGVLAKNENLQTSIALKRYPYPPYLEDNFIMAIQRTLPLLIMLSFFYTALLIVKSVVHEKELKMKEYMMMMGLSNWLHWLAWFLKYLIFVAISCVFMAAFYKIPTRYGSVLTNSDATVIFVFLILFAAATINLAFLISVFFSKANVGAAAGGVLYGLTYMPYLFMENSYDQLSLAVKVVSCLLSNVAMANGCQLIGMFEGKGSGLQWSNLNSSVTVDDNFTMLQVFLMLILDAVLYMMLAVYIEGVWPGEYGIPKRWYFPFTKSYWTGAVKKPSPILSVIEDVEGGCDGDTGIQNGGCINGNVAKEFFEEEPSQLRRVVEIKDLTKVFKTNGKEKVAVDRLNFNMYEGQINVLLGHNGAGKTTTMSMLTGFFPPTSGEASVLGHSITKDLRGVRQSLGYCPQHNILFDKLTVEEHLYFFARLKGYNKKEAQNCGADMTSTLKLDDKRHVQSHKLSGGMKRKLSVGIALVAYPKYVILDEPTSGMDPAARRAIWEVVQEYRSKCSMLLSTHFMDEADLLGDRIAIMADGKLRCAGSSVFLKSKFGVGYHVILTKSLDCDVTKLKEFFRSFVPEAYLERTAGSEVSFLLPFHCSSLFPKLFSALEDRSNRLGVENFGASVTTMEEVFLRVTEDADSALDSVNRKMSSSRSREMFDPKGEGHATPEDDISSPLQPQLTHLHSSLAYNSGATLWFQQFYGLFVKRFLHSKRNFKVAIAQLLVPVAFAIIAIINAKFPPFQQQNIALDLTLDAYGLNDVYYFRTPGSNFTEAFSESYRRQFQGTLETAKEVQSSDLEAFLSNKYKNEGGDFNSENLASATFSFDDVTNKSHSIAWFNDQAYHTPASSLAYLDQAYARMVGGIPGLNITLVNDPLPRNSTNRVEEQLIGSLSGFLIAFNVVLGFSFLAASFCLFLVRERVDRSSLLQTLAGVDPFCFWFSAFLWDFINFITPCLITMLMFTLLSVTEFSDHSGIVLLLFALYCWASLPFIYCLSFLFQVPSTALVRITILNIVTGLASIITINVLRLLSLTDAADALNWVFLLMPQYCLGQGLADLYANDKMVNICTESTFYEIVCKAENITYQTNFLAWDQYGVGRFATFMGIQGVLFFLILFLVAYDVIPMAWNDVRAKFRRLWRSCRRNDSGLSTPVCERSREDDDVAAERDRINLSQMPDLVATDRLIVKNLTKVYSANRGKGLVAVDNLCVGIPEAECFGLLGINGAGKTTTFKMLTGDYRPTSGTAFLDGFDIGTSLHKVQQRMGYCPQFDGLIEQMTGAETLWMFARLRGVPERDIPSCVANLGRILHFEQHLEKTCGTYSGGNKRKLSTAIALVGNPPVVLLDEPSTGMDPGAKRMLWDALADVRAMGCSIVITSHSMEECEALCTRLGIMVNGQLRCLGGPQHLKSRFGQGYTVEVKLSSALADLTTAKSFMVDSFPGCDLKDEHPGLLTYHIPQTTPGGQHLKLSTVFERMESKKLDMGLSDYTVSQTTLEQVFLNLVRWQREATEHHESNA